MPRSFDIDDFFHDGKLIATGVVIDGEAIFADDAFAPCGVTFTVRIEEQILGAKKGELVKVHHLPESRYPSLAVGSRYFFYAEDRSTHQFMVMGDEIDIPLEDNRPEKCHAK
ncbi:hypothetical protein ACFSJ3_03895 [Corallincola platygyrae]|uniref:Uncharacterized protein n=1 Tax=Corallincola platygyrae TaxID=1193278 RepID=A0ABW4XK17_9GAMM